MIGLELLRLIAGTGTHIFAIEDVKMVAKELGINSKYVPEMIHLLSKNQWIEILKKGTYAFTSESGMSKPPHEFEIAQRLIEPSAISHWTAMHYHQITQQTPNTIFSITPSQSRTPQKFKKQYHYKQVMKQRFFGFQKYWIENMRVNITDLEKTLLDSLSNPELCGGFPEVYNAFKLAKERIDIDKIIQYALKIDTATVKRLGWILEDLDIANKKLKKIQRHPIKGFRKLDPMGPNKGKYDHTWMLVLNA